MDQYNIGSVEFDARIRLDKIDADIKEIERKVAATPLKLKIDTADLTKQIQDAISKATFKLGGGGIGTGMPGTLSEHTREHRILHEATTHAGGIFGAMAGGELLGGMAGHLLGGSFGAGLAHYGFSTLNRAMRRQDVPVSQMAAAASSSDVPASGGGVMSGGPGVGYAFTTAGMACPQCGKPNQPGAGHCRWCGADLRSAWRRFQEAAPVTAGAVSMAGQTAAAAYDVSKFGGAVGIGAAGMGINAVQMAYGAGRGVYDFASWVVGGQRQHNHFRAATLDDVVASNVLGNTAIHNRLGEIHGALSNLSPSASGDYTGPSAADIGDATASAVSRRFSRLRRFQKRRPGGGGGGGGGGDPAGTGTFQDQSSLDAMRAEIEQSKLDDPGPFGAGRVYGSQHSLEAGDPNHLSFGRVRRGTGAFNRGRSGGYVNFGGIIDAIGGLFGGGGDQPPRPPTIDEQIWGPNPNAPKPPGMLSRSLRGFGVGVAAAEALTPIYQFSHSHDMARMSYGALGADAGRRADDEAIRANYQHTHSSALHGWVNSALVGMGLREDSEEALRTSMEAQAQDTRGQITLDHSRTRRASSFATQMASTDDQVSQARIDRDRFREDAMDRLHERVKTYSDNKGDPKIANKMMAEGAGDIEAQTAAMAGQFNRNLAFAGSQGIGQNAVMGAQNNAAMIGLSGNTIGASIAGFDAQRMASFVTMRGDLHGVSPITNPLGYLAAIGAHAGRVNAANIAQAQTQKDYGLGLQDLDYAGQAGQAALTGDGLGAARANIAGRRERARATMPSGQFARYSRTLDIEDKQAEFMERDRALGAKIGVDRINTSTQSLNLSAEGKDFQASIAGIRGNVKAQIEAVQSDSSLTAEEKQQRVTAIQTNGQAQLKGVTRRIAEGQTGGTATSFGNFINFAGKSTRRVTPYEDLNEAKKAADAAAKGLTGDAADVAAKVRARQREAEDLVKKQMGEKAGDAAKDATDIGGGGAVGELKTLNETAVNIYTALRNGFTAQ